MNEMKSSFGCGMKYNDLCNPVNCYEQFVRWPEAIESHGLMTSVLHKNLSSSILPSSHIYNIYLDFDDNCPCGLYACILILIHLICIFLKWHFIYVPYSYEQSFMQKG